MSEESRMVEILAVHSDEKSAKMASLLLCVMGFSWTFFAMSLGLSEGFSRMKVFELVTLAEGVALLFAGIGASNGSLTAIRIGLLAALVGISLCVASPELFVLFVHVLVIVFVWQGHSAMMRMEKRSKTKA